MSSSPMYLQEPFENKNINLSTHVLYSCHNLDGTLYKAHVTPPFKVMCMLYIIMHMFAHAFTIMQHEGM